MSNEDVNELINKGNKLNASGNYEEAIKCFAKAAKRDMNNAVVFHRWGNALANLAESKKDESLFKQAFEKYEEATQLTPNNAYAFSCWGNSLANFARIKKDESLFKQAFEKYDKATQLDPNDAFAFYFWGYALADLARIKKDESLFKQAFEKHDKATQLDPNDAFAFYFWGYALASFARIKEDKSLFEQAFEKYEKATQLDPDNELTFYSWGYSLSDFAKFSRDENAVENAFTEFYEKSNSFKKLKKDILEILVFFDNEKIRKLLDNIKLFYPLLDSDGDDGKFFKETTKNITDENELNRYKQAYILSVFIISQLHINNENEELVAHYREKTIVQKMLFKDTKFRLNAINYSNDPTEGKTLLDFLFGEGQYSAKEILNTEYGAFAGCFIFDPDSLNQFRLYGKEEGKEGTGLSLVFRSDFFSEEAKTAIKQENIASNKESKDGKHALFRCIYIDPVTQRVETVGCREDYLFFREKDVLWETDKDIEEKIKEYHRYITSIIKNVRQEMKQLKKSVKDLKPEIVGQLLINLRYLAKHIAFKEEQECRIVKIYRLDEKKIKAGGDFNRMYIKYKPKVSEHIEEIYFGPKAAGMELFQDILVHKNIPIPCVKSKNPLA